MVWNYVQNGLSPQQKKLPYLTARSRRTRNDTMMCNPAAPAIPPPRAAHRHPQRYHGVKPATPTTIRNDHAPLGINKPPIFAVLSSSIPTRSLSSPPVYPNYEHNVQVQVLTRARTCCFYPCHTAGPEPESSEGRAEGCCWCVVVVPMCTFFSRPNWFQVNGPTVTIWAREMGLG